jgi:hypothetical protein
MVLAIVALSKEVALAGVHARTAATVAVVVVTGALGSAATSTPEPAKQRVAITVKGATTRLS